MKALMDPHMMENMPNVAAWLRHSHAAEHVVRSGYADLDDAGLVRAASLETIVVQLAHLRTHPSVAAGIARGEILLPGWFVDINLGAVMGLQGAPGQFLTVRGAGPPPVAPPTAPRHPIRREDDG